MGSSILKLSTTRWSHLKNQEGGNFRFTKGEVGDQYLLIATDDLSGWVGAVALSSLKASRSTEVLFEHWICRYGAIFVVKDKKGNQSWQRNQKENLPGNQRGINKRASGSRIYQVTVRLTRNREKEQLNLIGLAKSLNAVNQCPGRGHRVAIIARIMNTWDISEPEEGFLKPELFSSLTQHTLLSSTVCFQRHKGHNSKQHTLNSFLILRRKQYLSNGTLVFFVNNDEKFLLTLKAS